MSPAELRDRSKGERGSALMLMPAGVLIVLFLGALTLDAAVVFTAQRQFADAAAAAAGDAAVAGVDADRFYRCGVLVLDAGRVDGAAAAAVAVRGADLAVAGVSADIGADTDGVPTVSVTLRGSARRIFAGRLPGVAAQVPIRATATSRADAGPAGVVTGTC